MFCKVTEDLREEVILYLKKDILNCVYLYINLLKYGLGNSNMIILADIDENNEIRCVVVKYFNGIQIYSEKNNFDTNELVGIIQTINPSVISGNLKTISKISYDLKEHYNIENGYVSKLDSSLVIENKNSKYKVEKNNKDLLYDIAKLICSDGDIGSHYNVDGLYKQLKERKEDNFGRNYIIKDNLGIACHSATYAEVDDMAVIGGVITRLENRGMGMGKYIVLEMCKDLVKEGKEVYLFYENEIAGNLYKKIGFNNTNEWTKLKRK